MLRFSINRRYFALSALQDSYTHYPQGVALGYYISRLLALGSKVFTQPLPLPVLYRRQLITRKSRLRKAAIFRFAVRSDNCQTRLSLCSNRGPF
ncbi:hypothetical protein BH20ACI3_BH20ACI3_40590 [soil metagenome]